MRRRICLAVGLVALAVPATGSAQSSSQAQYQGVAPETQLPVTGNGGGPGTGGGAAATSGAQSTATGGGRPVSGGNRGAKATGGTKATGTAGATSAQPKVALPQASSSTSPLSGGDIVLVVLAAIGLTGLGLLLRRSTRRSPAV
jgi:cobalamin biosynthesis Mg chelatase CobN